MAEDWATVPASERLKTIEYVKSQVATYRPRQDVRAVLGGGLARLRGS
jgi:hypothetical protein